MGVRCGQALPHLLVRSEDHLDAATVAEAANDVCAEEHARPAVLVGQHAAQVHRVVPEGGVDWAEEDLRAHRFSLMGANRWGRASEGASCRSRRRS